MNYVCEPFKLIMLMYSVKIYSITRFLKVVIVH